jgi:hypothetical protein
MALLSGPPRLVSQDLEKRHRIMDILVAVVPRDTLQLHHQSPFLLDSVDVEMGCPSWNPACS